MAVVSECNSDQVPLGGGAAGREAAYDGEGGKQEEHIAELHGDGQGLAWKVLVLVEIVKWDLVGIVFERVVHVHDVCPDTANFPWSASPSAVSND